MKKETNKKFKNLLILFAVMLFCGQFITSNGKNVFVDLPDSGGNFDIDEQETVTEVGGIVVYEKVVVVCIEPGPSSCTPSCKERYNPNTTWIDCSEPPL